MTENEKFAIFWCFNKAMKHMDNAGYQNYDSHKDVIVNGVNITETIRGLLGKLFV
jgi:hypothetical protein